VRRASRTDANHSEIVKAAEQAFCSVLQLHQVGGGCPDLILGLKSRHGPINLLVEVKTEDGSLTPDQIRFHREWRGQRAVIRSINELRALLESL
jgi:VRR-NUC domain-containing protein